MAKDWTGNAQSTFATLGASSHSEGERQGEDYYATDPKCAHDLHRLVELNNVWECAAGGGHLSNVFRQYGVLARESDIIDRTGGVQVIDFLTHQERHWGGDIVTNPPYRHAEEFVRKALDTIAHGNRVCMFLKLTFLEGKARRHLFKEHPPTQVMVYSERQKCAKNGDFNATESSAVAYAWFIWEKGYQGAPTIRWI